MGTTTNFSLPYPEMSDPPNGPGAFQNLAVAVDTALHGLPTNPISQTLLDAKGDLIVASAPDTAARLPVGTNGQLLTADSAQATGVKWANAPTGSFTDIDFQVFTSSGTWNKPAGAVKVSVQVLGGGGAGSSNTTQAVGGGAGGYALKVAAASSLGSTVSVTVGAGGAGTIGGAGASGGNSTFDTVTANGGGGGATTVPATGGTASGGDLNVTGTGTYLLSSGGSPGGQSVFAGAAQGATTSAVGYGSGGAGTANNTIAGGNGKSGLVIVTTYISA